MVMGPSPSFSLEELKKSRNILQPVTDYGPIFGEYLARTAKNVLQTLQDPVAPIQEKRLTKPFYEDEFAKRFREETDPLFTSGIFNAQLPFGDKTLGEGVQNVALGLTPLDVGFGVGFASKAVQAPFKYAGAKITNSKGKKVFGALEAITAPISKSDNPGRRFAAEMAFDQSIQLATQLGGPAFGLLAPLATNLVGRSIINTTKGIRANPPKLSDYLNNPAAVNAARPTRIIPVNEGPLIGGASLDPEPLEFYGRNASASTTGNSPDPRFSGNGEFQRLDFKIKLMDANEIITSNDPYSPNFAKDGRYPEIKQPRERLTTREEQIELITLAKTLRADDLIDNTSRLDTGMPIIGDKHVESGNKRMMAIKLAKKDFPDVYNDYVTRLRERLEEFGIAKTDLDRFDLDENIPVIVRERQTKLPDDALTPYVIDANTSQVEAFSAVEEAGQLAEGWNPDLLNRIIPTGKTIQETLKATRNSEVINSFKSYVKGNPNSKNWFKNGKLTEEGVTKLVQGLRVRIFGQDNADFLIKNIDELPDQQTKSLFNAIDESLPQLAVIKGKINKFTSQTDYDISTEIIGAIKRFRSLKEQAGKNNQSVKTAIDVYLNQTQMFNEFASDPVELQLLNLFNGHGKGSNSSKQISSVFSKYEELVEENIGQQNMFEPLTKLQILEQAIKKAAPEGTEINTGATGRLLNPLDKEIEYQKKTIDDKDFDKDIDDPVSKKDQKELEKKVREEGNYTSNEDLATTNNKLESDLNPKNSSTSRNNIDSPLINTGQELDIPMTATARKRHDEKPIVETTQKEIIIKEKDILDSNDVTRLVPTQAFRNLIGNFTIELHLSSYQLGINRVYKILNRIPGLNPEKLDLLHKEKNIIDGIRKFYDQARSNIESKTAAMTAEITARVNGNFNVDKKTGLINGVGFIEKQVTDIKGQVVLKNGKPIIKEFRPTINDIAADPSRFNLTQQQLTTLDSINETMIPVSQLWKEIPQIYKKYKYAENLTTVRKDINKDNGFWMPRGGAFEDGNVEQFIIPKNFNKAKAWNKSAIFDSMGEAIDNGYQYQSLAESLSTNIRQIMMQNVIDAIEKAAKNIRDVEGDISFKTFDDIFGEQFPEIIKRKKEAVKEFTRLTSLKNVLEVRTQELVDGLLNEKPKDAHKILEIIQKKQYVIKAGKSSGMTRKEIENELKIVEKKLITATKEYDNAKKTVSPEIEGYEKLEDLNYAELNDMYLDKSAAKSFNQFIKDIEPRDSKTGLALIRAYNAVYLRFKSTVDNSGIAIQGLVGLVTNPKTWAVAVKANLKALANNKDAMGQAYIEFNAQAAKTGRFTSNQWINVGLVQNTDVVRLQSGGLDVTETKGRVKAFMDKLPFDDAFTTFGNTYRLAEADDLLADELARGHTMKSLIESGRINDIARIANTLSGTTTTSSRYRRVVDVGSIFLFAQRYYLTRLRFFQKAVKGTATGSVLGVSKGLSNDLEARILAKRMQKFFLYTATLVTAINAMQGRETDYSPIVKDTQTGKLRKNGNFMTIRTPWGKDYTPMGAVINVPGHVFNFISGTVNAIQTKSLGKALKTGEDTLSSVGSGIFKTSMDLLTNEEWNGTPIRNKTDSASQQLADMLLYSVDAFAPFSLANLGEELADSVNATKQYWKSEKKALDLGVLVKDYGINSVQALLEFGGIMSSDNSYTDILIQEAKNRGFDYLRLEPHQKRDFKYIVEQTYKGKEREGLARAAGKLIGISSEPAQTDLQILQEERLYQHSQYLLYLKRGYGEDKKTYTIKMFAQDVKDADDFYYTAKYGATLNEGNPFSDENSFEETSENVIALEEWYDLGELYYDKKLKKADQEKYNIQDALFRGEQIKLKDGSIVGNWSKEQREYVTRNINDLYYEPQVLQRMLQAGRSGIYPLKYWYASRQKSEQARERFEKAGSPGTALDPNASFFWDSRTFNLRVDPGPLLKKPGKFIEQLMPTFQSPQLTGGSFAELPEMNPVE